MSDLEISRRLVRRVRALWHWLLDRRQRRNNRTALGALNDHLSHDLGFHPDQIDRLRWRRGDDLRPHRRRWRDRDP